MLYRHELIKPAWEAVQDYAHFTQGENESQKSLHTLDKRKLQQNLGWNTLGLCILCSPLSPQVVASVGCNTWDKVVVQV